MSVPFNSPLIQNRLRPNEDVLWAHVVKRKVKKPPVLPPQLATMISLSPAVLALGLSLYAYLQRRVETGADLKQNLIVLFLFIFVLTVMGRVVRRSFKSDVLTFVTDMDELFETIITDQRVLIFNDEDEQSFERVHITKAELDWDKGARSVRVTEARTGTTAIVARYDAQKVLLLIQTRLMG